MNRRRVLVTGLGCVTPVGNDVPSSWKSLLSGRSGVQRVPWLEQESCAPKIGALVRDFDPEAIEVRQDIRRLGRCSQLALAAAVEAWRDAKLSTDNVDPNRAGVIIGTGLGDISECSRQTENHRLRAMKGIYPLYVPVVMPNAPTAHAALEFGCRGPSFATVTACAASGHAIGLALRLIQWGDADLMVAGGTEEFALLTYGGFVGLRTLSTRNEDPERASRPFDRTRDGFVMGEGSGVLILEEREHALARKAPIYAEIAGFGMTSDAYHLTAPDPSGKGAVRAMEAALKDAGRTPEEVQYINAHGTSTALNDKIETMAIRQVFGAHADRLAVSSTKSMIGHLLGAAGAVGVIATVLSIRDSMVHPTINYEHRDPACDLDYVPNEARPLETRVALASAFGFGGHCACVAVTQHSH